jgi:protein-S-isoprenylcysteine O-methyltransferase Ste14
MNTKKGGGIVSFFKMGLDNVQEILVLALMLVFIFAVIYSNMDLAYKIGTGALVFAVIFATGLASQALKQQKEEDKKRLK